jgi:16S rRNA (guanine527-N7)-methyltransferase
LGFSRRPKTNDRRLLLYPARVTPDAIAELLVPFLGEDRLSSAQLDQFAAYLDLLSRWNARTNLTAVREATNIVSRHFGESLFAARSLARPADLFPAADLGSGAGFPGLPLKIWAPSLRLTLIESQNKKATFLREVVRALQLKDVAVFSGRAEDLVGDPPSPLPLANGGRTRFDLVTLRAVERFDAALAAAAPLLAPKGRLALLIGEAQVSLAMNQLRQFRWSEPLSVPLSRARVLLVGQNLVGHEPT